MEYSLFRLKNGIRVVHQHVPGAAVSHCGVTVLAGSRDESANEIGLAHFIEHCLFKGTKKRRAFHILSRLDAVGGEINAYTTKEETCVYGSFMTAHYPRAVELISDILFNSQFPSKEIEREKDVILDEINSYLDTPAEQIFDDFEDVLFAGHGLGHNILGDSKSVKSFKKKNIISFLENNYTSDKIVFSSVGDISENRLSYLLDRFFADYELKEGNKRPVSFRKVEPRQLVEKKEIFQAHFVMGAPAYSVYDDRKTALVLLNNILGGPAMNSRLNINIREKYGFAYNLDSTYTPYSDTGAWIIYLGTEAASIDRCKKLVFKELKKLREQALGTRQLHQAKLQLKGHISLGQESRVNVMLGLGKSLLIFDKIDTIAEVNHKIDAISEGELLEIANDIFAEEGLSSILYHPTAAH